MGKIDYKQGVEFIFVPAGMRILEAAKAVVKPAKYDVTITSGSDGAHSGPADPHKRGSAYDFRTHNLTPTQKANFLKKLKDELGDGFYVALESADTPNEHIHAQLAQNTLYSVLDYLNE